MNEVLAVPGFGDHRPCRGVDRLAGNAWPNGLECRLIRPQNGLIDGAVLIVRFANVNGARHIRMVPFDNPAPVKDDGIARLNEAITREVMWRCRIWTARANAER